MIIEPHCLNILLSFTYRGFEIEIERDQWHGQNIYAAWANYEQGCAVAVPCAVTPTEAIQRAKKWVDRKLAVSSKL